jgi:predicted hydrocarbon binding protein
MKLPEKYDGENKNRMKALSQVVRPKLGDTIPLSVFRVFRQFSALHAEEILGRTGTKVVFQHAGRQLGIEVGKSLHIDDLQEYLNRVFEYVEDNGIGILSVNTDEEGKMIFKLDECITCAGMPDIGKKICHFEVGIVAGAVEAFLGESVAATESKCNADGDDFCEVTVTV